MLIDTHSHIYDKRFDGDRDDAIGRALSAGVGRIYLPAIDSGSHEAMLRTCAEHPGVCFPMMGLHPTSVNDNPEYMQELETVEKYLSGEYGHHGSIKFHAIGEIGLDLHWSRDHIKQQTEVFERQIELSLTYGLPLVIHTREAWQEMTGILHRYRQDGLKGIMHAFSGTYRDYVKVKECGDFVFGIGGTVTYKNSTLAELLPRMDMRDIVLETDSPYLPPVPHRGKRNESSYLTLICDEAARIYGRSREEVASQTTANTLRILG